MGLTLRSVSEELCAPLTFQPFMLALELRLGMEMENSIIGTLFSILAGI